jgi:hypothetical protein
MKKIFLLSLSGLIAFLLFNIKSLAQETRGDKVAVQITKDGKVITDTVFQLKEGQDPEAVKKVIAHVLEGDIQVISGKEGHQRMVWATSENDKHLWHAEDIDVDMDSIIKHEEKVMVFKGDSGEDHHHKVIVRKGPEGEETVVVRSGDDLEVSEEEGEGSKIIIIEEKGTKECENHPKHVKVFVEGDDEMEILDDEDLKWIEKEDADNVDVYVIKKDNGTEVVKKVRVEVKTDEEDDNGNKQAVEPPQKEPVKPEKKKK